VYICARQTQLIVKTFCIQHIYIYTRIYIYIYTYIQIHIYSTSTGQTQLLVKLSVSDTYTDAYTSAYIRIYIYTYVQVLMYFTIADQTQLPVKFSSPDTYTYTYISAYIHTYMYTHTYVLYQRGSDPIACKTLGVWRDAVRDMAAAWAAFAVPTPGNVSKASFLFIFYSSFTIKQRRPKHGGSMGGIGRSDPW